MLRKLRMIGADATQIKAQIRKHAYELLVLSSAHTDS